MSHRPELLSAMLDGELSESEAAWVAAHLDGCGQCRSELDGLASARSAVRGLPMLDLPEDVHPGEPRVTRLWPRRVAVAAMSAAAAAAVTIGALGMIGMASDSSTAVDVGEAEAILAATRSLGVITDGSEAAEYVTSGATAHFSARQTMACLDHDALIDRTVDVTSMGSVTVMSDPLSQLTVLAYGSVATGPVSGPIASVTVTGPAPELDDYDVTAVMTEERHDRATEIVTLGKAGIDRARLWIDVETGVIVHRELLAADGSVSCVADLVEFEPSDTPIQASIPFDLRAEVTETTYDPVTTEFPSVLGGLELVAAYPVEDGEVGVYGDGVFTMAVVRVSGGHPDSVSADRSPTHVWESGGASWAVVGALPSDLLEAVLDGLPAPDDPNPFIEGWRILFG
ncbi:MAG: zf-HC2 domain-containing protein [Acidimicrobiia bacterium]